MPCPSKQAAASVTQTSRYRLKVSDACLKTFPSQITVNKASGKRFGPRNRGRPLIRTSLRLSKYTRCSTVSQGLKSEHGDRSPRRRARALWVPVETTAAQHTLQIADGHHGMPCFAACSMLIFFARTSCVFGALAHSLTSLLVLKLM